MITVLSFIFVLGVLVLVHEFGHFIVAKIFKVKVEEFGFGFPPRVFAKKKGETLYSLNLIPIGGFVKIKGIAADDHDLASFADADSFAAKKAWQRFLILSAGIVFNALFGIFLLAALFSLGVSYSLDNLPKGAKILHQDSGLLIYEVIKDMPAEKGGLLAGERILAVDGMTIENREQFIQYNQTKKEGEKIKIKTEQGEKEITLSKLNNSELGIGVALMQTGKVAFSPHYAFWLALQQSYQLLEEIGRVLSELFHGIIPQEIGGPVAIAKITGVVIKTGFAQLLIFIALLSLNLAVVNFLPFPALDGSHFIFLLIEKIIGRPVNKKIEALVHRAGFAILIILIILVTFRDIRRF